MVDGGSPTPYIPNTDADRRAMLERIGAGSVRELFDVLPAEHRDPEIDLPSPHNETALIERFRTWAELGPAAGTPSFLGAGAYRRFIPSITPNLVSRSEFVTAYTPYQSEISQGTLQSAFEYQSTVCELFGMDVSNTGLYDVGSATAEACLLAARVTKRRAVAVLEPIHPGTLAVIRTYAYAGDLRVDTVRSHADVTDEHACLVVQQPDFLGGIRDIKACSAAAHDAGALAVVVADPLAHGLLRAPGDAGADVVTGEGRDLAFPVTFGGPSLGLFAAKQEFIRQMPGRIVGQTTELHGPPLADGSEGEPRTGYVLTLQAREQFIRRERATSNFSTGQSLLALAFTITVQSLGARGFGESAEACYHRAHEAAERIHLLDGFDVVDRGPWFQEFLVRGERPAPEVAAKLRAGGIEPGLDVSSRPEPEAANALLFCVTEATRPADINRLVAALDAIGGDE